MMIPIITIPISTPTHPNLMITTCTPIGMKQFGNLSRSFPFSRNEDLNLSQEGKPTKDEGLMEESFCSNFVCCGVHLADLHALLQHYEDVHVKVQNVDEEVMASGILGEDDECGELDVVGDSLAASASKTKSGPSRLLAPPEVLGRQTNRADSTLSTQSFGSTAAADALLGVATNYQPPYLTRPRTADPYGYDYMQYQHYAYAPVPGYYTQVPRPASGHEVPVSAFDTTTILRTASPAYHTGAFPAPPAYYHPGQPFYAGGHPMMPGMIPHYANMPHHLPNMVMSGTSGMQSGQDSASKGKSLKRPRSTSALHSMKAAQAASNTLRESLPAVISEQDANPYKLIYSILSSTIDPASKNPSNESLEDGNPAAAEALLAMDPGKSAAANAASLAARNAAAILSLPRPPVDKTLERPYICPVPGCGKSYKNPNGLKYHALHGHDGTNELVERPHKCPYGDCGKRYKNPNGLKYHINKNHADMLPKSAVMAKAAQEASKAAAEAAALANGLPFDPTAPCEEEEEEFDDSDAHDHE